MATIINGAISGEAVGDGFGHSVSLNSDGSIVAISAPFNEADLTQASSVIGNISNNTNLFYQITGHTGWSKAGIYSDLFIEADDIEIQSYDWDFRTDLIQIPSVPYSENPYVDIIEFSNLSTGGKNIFGVIFDNVDGVSGENYAGKYNGETWNYKDDITYLIEDTNQNSTLDSSDIILREVNRYGLYSDFGGLNSEGGSYNSNSTSGFHKKVGIDAGSVKVFKNNGSEWTLLGNEITGNSLWDQKGVSTSLSADGETLVVGNPYSLDSSSLTRGQVSIFKLKNGEWSEIANIISDNSTRLDHFGYATSLSSDGKTLAVGGLWGTQGEATDNAGYIKVFEIGDSSYTQIGDALTGDNLNEDEFGFSVDLSSDGSIVAVSSAQGGDVFVYQRNENNWSQIGDTIAFYDYDSDSKPSSIFKQESVVQTKLSEDGNYLAIGSPNADVGGLNNGLIKVYQNINNSWVQVGSDITGQNLGHLGTFVDLEKDNNGFLTLAGAGTTENSESYVNLYKLINSEWISFVSIDSSDNQSFPTNSLDISSDGSTLAIGTSHSPVNSSIYDDNYLSAGYIGYKDQTGSARIYQISIEGDSDNNVISGNSSANYLVGYGGNDLLLGNGGNDILSAGTGNDVIYGGSGNNYYIGGSGEIKNCKVIT